MYDCLVKLPVGPDKVTLADFKNVLNRKTFEEKIIRPQSLRNPV